MFAAGRRHPCRALGTRRHEPGPSTSGPRRRGLPRTHPGRPAGIDHARGRSRSANHGRPALTFHGAGDPAVADGVLRVLERLVPRPRSSPSGPGSTRSRTWGGASSTAAMTWATTRISTCRWGRSTPRRRTRRSPAGPPRSCGAPARQHDGSARPDRACHTADPGGRNRAGFEHCIGYDVDPADYTDPGARLVTARTLRSARAGAIVSLHLGHAGTLTALPAVLRGLDAHAPGGRAAHRAVVGDPRVTDPTGRRLAVTAPALVLAVGLLLSGCVATASDLPVQSARCRWQARRNELSPAPRPLPLPPPPPCRCPASPLLDPHDVYAADRPDALSPVVAGTPIGSTSRTPCRTQCLSSTRARTGDQHLPRRARAAARRSVLGPEDAVGQQRSRQHAARSTRRTGTPGAPGPRARPVQPVLHPGRQGRGRDGRAPTGSWCSATRTRWLCRPACRAVQGVNHADWTADGRFFLVSCEFDGKLLWGRHRAAAVVARLSLPPGSAPQDVKLSPRRPTFYVADMMSDGVWILHTSGTSSRRSGACCPPGRARTAST